MGGFTYTAFGLTIASDMHFPELLSGSGEPDITVVRGEVPATLPGAEQIFPRCYALPGQLLLDVIGSARFLVRHGNEIIFDPHPDASEDDVRLYLLGSAMGALMHQRGILVLHGCTVLVNGGGVVFLGNSGSGKSTLATELSRRGYPCIGDDLCAVSIGDDGVPHAAPAYPQAKLCLDALEHFGLEADKLRRIRPSRDKRAVPLAAHAVDPVLLKGIYILHPVQTGTGVRLRRVNGPMKIRALRDHTYRVRFLRALDLSAHHFTQIAHLASTLPLTRICRSPEECPIDLLADAVEELLAERGLAAAGRHAGQAS